MTNRISMALTAFGLPHALGYLATKDGTKSARPLSLTGLMDAAVELNLTGVEFPLMRTGMPPAEELRDELQARDLRFVGAMGTPTDCTIDEFENALSAAATLGARVVRVTLSKILCGDRRGVSDGWEAYLSAAAARLKELLPRAEAKNLSIAVENHQDATSDDLLRLAEMTGSSPAYGVCLDAGNPLAVGEGPVEFARRLAPLIRHIHLKDYTIHFAPDGYHLVRCAAGDGVVDFPEILRIVHANGFDGLLPGIEIAAQQTRTIPLLEDSWWACYPERHPAYLVEALRVLWAKGRPVGEPYSSPWERGADSETVLADEWDVVRRSASYFAGIAG